MGILKEVLYLSIILAASSESRPISLHNYAPAHEYKSTDYSFSYGVKDPHTGDVKNQWEEKKDNIVRGEYSLVEADGSTRTVQYTADDKNGFNAVVKYDQHSVHPISAHEEAYSHHSLKLNPSRESAAVYSSYTNKVEEQSPLDAEVQTVVQHDYKLPKSYSEVQSQAIQQHYESQTENEQAQEQPISNQKVKYIFIPQKIATSEENNVEQVQNQQEQTKYIYESDQNDDKQQDEEQHESQQQEVQQIINSQEQNIDDGKYTIQNIQASQLPLNLNLLPDSNNKIPVDISLLNPIDIDLSKVLKEQAENSNKNQETAAGENYKYSTKDYSIQPSHEFTSEEVQKFIDDYNAKLGEPVYETGFVPITTKPNHLITQPMVPNTYKSNLKVNMTPGLKHYSSRGNKKFKKNKYETLLLGQQQLLPLFYTSGVLNEDGHRKYHRSVPNRNQFIRNPKHFRIVQY